ncbi:tetratricopeptide repeat protein [Niveispirillum irakense]|uniref:tetratricopeptide repeat protein n=1 Tax=Niveispirillum irakense TaxID=34011 RepID=UPI000426A205|nr:tetratricopeptide repeat protein [Niveispirillum irakense]
MDRDKTQSADSPASLLSAAIARHQGGDAAGAIPLYRAVLARLPKQVDATHLLGLALWQTGVAEEGLALVQKAAKADPKSASIQNNLGGMLMAQRRFRDAEAAFRRALALKADMPDAWSNLAAVLLEQERPADAEVAARRATKIAPQRADGWSNLGAALGELARPQEAEHALRQALQINSSFPMAHANLGNLLRRQGRLEDADACFRKALSLDPHLPVAKLNVALDLFGKGKLAEAWPLYEERFRAKPGNAGRDLPLPPWQGGPLKGARLLVRPEQGLGDEIMFAGFLPPLDGLDGPVTVQCDARLVPLLRRSFSGLTVAAAEERVAADYQIAVASLGGFLRRDLASFDGKPWLVPDPAGVAAWRRYLENEAGGRLTIGFCWRSGLRSANREGLYSRLADWAPLFALPGICWVPLQYDLAVAETRAELDAAVVAYPDACFLRPEGLDLRDDQDGVAALMGALDLVISAGTAVGELAGALGVPVWRFSNDDDWTRLGTAVRPWYGSMRDFKALPRLPAASMLPTMARHLRDLLMVPVPVSVPAPAPLSPDALQRAMVLHQSGNRAAAIPLYRAVLAHDPDDVMALHLLGYALSQEGQAAEGVPLMRRAVALKPDYVAALVNLANCLRMGGDPVDAIPFYRQALTHRPDSSGTQVNLALALNDKGDNGEAEALLRRCLAAQPGFAAALDALGHVLAARGDKEGAIAAHRDATRADPNFLAGWVNLGQALKAADRAQEALAPLRRALDLNPGSVEARTSLGSALVAVGRTVPGFMEEGLTLLAQVAGEAPDYANAQIDYAQALATARRPTAAVAVLDRLLDRRPGEVLARTNRAMLDLELGRLDRGWADQALRFHSTQQAEARSFTIPPWQGQDVAGKRVLVWREQGIGDELMFGSLLPALQVLGAVLVVECSPRLVGLFARSLPGALVRAETPDPTDADYHCPMGDLPRWLRPRLGDFATARPWLAPDPDRAADFARRVDALGPGLRVGICWRSGLVDSVRAPAYLSLADLLPILSLPGIIPINLQYGDTKAEVAALARDHGITLHRWDDLDLKQDLEGAAALTAGLDLVISASTSVGEMAASLGVPTWRFQPTPDWTCLGTAVRPWFACMRVFMPVANAPVQACVAPMRAELQRLLTVPEVALPVANPLPLLPPGPPPAIADVLRLHQQGDLAGAEQGYRTILAHDPDHGDALHLLAVVRLAQGDGVEALALVDQALAADPDFAIAHNSRGSVLKALGQPEDAARAFRQALALRPQYPEAWTNLGTALMDQCRPAEAVTAHQRALKQRPDYPRALANLGVAQHGLGQYAQAAGTLRQALALDDNLADAWSYLGLCLARQGNIAEAMACQDRALAADPGFAEAEVNRSLLLVQKGDGPAARDALDRALALRPGFGRALYNHGLLSLALGDLKAGWQGHEARFDSGEVRGVALLPLPRWQGEPLAGRRLLVQREQGLGDEVMFAGLYRHLGDLDGDVVVEADPRLIGLFSRAFPFARFVPEGEGMAHAPDLAIPAGSLPSLVRPALAGWDGAAFLSPLPDKAAAGADRLAALGPGLKIGLCWRSQLQTADRVDAYTTLADWLPLARLPGVQVVSLQYDGAVEEIAAFEAAHGITIHRWPDLDQKNDLEAVAGLMMGLDLVISTATAVGELAGALGVPVWRLSGALDWTRLGTGVRPWFASQRIITVPAAGKVVDQVPVVVRLLTSLGQETPPAPPPLPVGTVEELLGQGVEHQRGGDPQAAMPFYRAVLDQAPEQPVALHLLGLAHHQMGELAAAEPLMRRALTVEPAYTAAWVNFGNLLQDRDQPAAAEKAYRQALAQQPVAPEVWSNLGNALRRLNRREDALAAQKRALSLKPGWVVALANMAELLRDMDRPEEAADAYRQALAAGGEDALLRTGLGEALRMSGDLAGAEAAHRQALADDPALADAWNNLGRVESLRGLDDAARRHYDKALSLAPDLPAALYNRSLLDLADGDLTGGWRGYASRFAGSPDVRGRDIDLPVWRGEPLDGRRLLVWGEQGIGDQIMFAAAYPALLALGGRVVMETDPRLVGLFTRSFPQALVRAAQPRPTDADLAIAAGDLAGILWPHLADIAPPMPLLCADASAQGQWAARLAALGPGLKVGLAWRSSSITVERALSYTDVTTLAPLARVPGMHLVDLQLGATEAEKERAAKAGLTLHRFDDLDLRDDLDGLAALIAGLDLVIAVPTFIGELAGALGTPTWRLSGPDWTSLGTAIRPWYPAMRLLAREGEGANQAVARAVSLLLSATRN